VRGAVLSGTSRRKCPPRGLGINELGQQERPERLGQQEQPGRQRRQEQPEQEPVLAQEPVRGPEPGRVQGRVQEPVLELAGRKRSGQRRRTGRRAGQ